MAGSEARKRAETASSRLGLFGVCHSRCRSEVASARLGQTKRLLGALAAEGADSEGLQWEFGVSFEKGRLRLSFSLLFSQAGVTEREASGIYCAPRSC